MDIKAESALPLQMEKETNPVTEEPSKEGVATSSTESDIDQLPDATSISTEPHSETSSQDNEVNTKYVDASYQILSVESETDYKHDTGEHLNIEEKSCIHCEKSGEQQLGFPGFKGYFFFSDGNYRLLQALTGRPNIPALVIFDPNRQQHYVFPEETNLNYFSLVDFISAFLNGSLLPYQKSETVLQNSRKATLPPFVNLDFHQVDSIPRVTTHTFSELVVGSNESDSAVWNKDVLVLFSNRWSGFCQRMELVVHEVYRAIQGYAKMRQSESKYEKSTIHDMLGLWITSSSSIKCTDFLMNQNAAKRDTKFSWLRRLRDRIFVFTLFIFMLFVICGGVWAVHPVLFTTSYFSGIIHSIVTFILSVSTIYLFSFAAFKRAGTPPCIVWGSYPAVGKGGLENYTFCHLCSWPKSPRTHHCRTCGMCILDMDHHCSFIRNCVGADNHPHFIALLISVISSTAYVSITAVYICSQLWPSVTFEPIGCFDGHSFEFAFRYIRELILGLLGSALYLDLRGIVLVYLFILSVSLGFGLFILLWQQLCFIYEGKTYLSDLSSQGNDEVGEKDCLNIVRFFGWPYTFSRFIPLWSVSRLLPSFQKKRHAK